MSRYFNPQSAVLNALFNSAIGASFSTPLWHWALHWRELSFVPDGARDSVERLSRAALSMPIILPSGVSRSHRWSWRRCGAMCNRTQLGRWMATTSAIPLPPQWLPLCDHVGDGCALRVHLPKVARVKLSVVAQSGGRPLAYAVRFIDFDTLQAEHRLISIAREKRGLGTSTQLLANTLAFYARHGIRSVTLATGLTAGGATWAKFGFRPVDQAEWTRLKSTIARNLALVPANAHAVFAAQTGYPLHTAVQSVLAIDKPQGIWRLVDLDAQGDAAEKAGLDEGFGGFLLRGTRWKGILDLRDAAANERVALYFASKARLGEVDLPLDWPWRVQ